MILDKKLVTMLSNGNLKRGSDSSENWGEF